MRYLTLLPSLVIGTDDVFRRAVDGKSRFVLVINMVILGALFGLSNLIGISGQEGSLDMENRFILLLTLLMMAYGTVIMCTALFALCLIYWAAAKALGGQGGLMTCLELIGMATVPFWVLAPLLNYLIRYVPAGNFPIILMVPLIGAFVWSFILLRKSMMAGQGLSEGKATLAVAMMWLFSISAIYVFLP